VLVGVETVSGGEKEMYYKDAREGFAGDIPIGKKRQSSNLIAWVTL
jgi:hypothetical protein